VICRRHGPDPEPTAAPELAGVVNNRTREPFFHSTKDEYMCVYFDCAEPRLTIDSLYVEVDGFGTQTLVLAGNETKAAAMTGYQANCLRSPGLDPGHHEVRIPTRHSARSNPVAFTLPGSE
jgi:hypothetical protein